MIDAADLKPCPSCGTKHEDGYIGVYFVDDNAASLACHKCGCETGPCVGTDYDEAIRLACDRWNRRPIEDALRAENERLREALNATQTILNTVDLSRLEYQDRSKFYDVVFIDGIIDKALKGGNE